MYDEVFQEAIEDTYCVTHSSSLIQKAQQGDKDALERIVTENTPLVRSIVKRFLNRGCEYDDLMQLGTIGLIKAARNFDTGYGVRFSTYAVPLITGEIKRFLRDDGIVKVSRELKRNAMNVALAREEYEKRHGREPTLSELSRICDLSVEEIAQALDAARPVASIYEEQAGDGDGITLEDRLPAEDESERNELRLMLSDLLETLDEDERKIIVLRYFRDMTQSQVAKLVGISQVQVSRKEKKILGILKERAG